MVLIGFVSTEVMISDWIRKDVRHIPSFLPPPVLDSSPGLTHAGRTPSN